MVADSLFRLVFAALFLTGFAVAASYRRRAQAGRTMDYTEEGTPVLIGLRVGGLALWGYCLVYIAYPPVLDWSFVQLPPGVRWVGAAIGLLSISLIASAQRALGRNVSPTVMTHDDHELVTTGPYRLIRNPLYAFGVLFFASLGVVAASWFLPTMAALALVLIGIRLPTEEAELERRFGQPYRDYVGRTGRFIPRLTPLAGKSVAPPMVFVLPSAFLLHLVEEWFGGFSAWTGAVLGNAVSPEQFLVINGISLVVFLVGTVAATHSPRAAWFAVSLAALLGLNGVLHTLATLGFGRYSPGTITGLLLSLPLGVLVLRSSSNWLPKAVFGRAVVLGVLGHAVVALAAFA